MPDKKLTDSEIVKKFQLCTLKAEHPGFILCGQIVDLINRLQAENERLNAKLKSVYKELERIASMTVETDRKDLVGG